MSDILRKPMFVKSQLSADEPSLWSFFISRLKLQVSFSTLKKNHHTNKEISLHMQTAVYDHLLDLFRLLEIFQILKI